MFNEVNLTSDDKHDNPDNSEIKLSLNKQKILLFLYK